LTNLIGHSLGRYHILEQLGEGGMATVYKAYDTRLETNVAVKVIRTDNLAPSVLEHSLKRFEREAKALARLTHPNIVKVTDYGEYDGKPYLVMPYLPGGTLKLRLGRPIQWQHAARLLLPIARALDYAHRQNMIHRDVKPSNILITADSEPMLTDFGIAKILDEENTMELTGSGVTVGTPEYMAPEQVTGKSIDHRADIYALGIVFYEMVTGRRPFLADTPVAVLFKQASAPLPRPRQFVPDLPQIVENILIKALAKNPDERYQDMAAFSVALEKLAMGQRVEIPGAHTTTSSRNKSETARLAPVQRHFQNDLVGIVMVGVLLLCLLGAATGLIFKDELLAALSPGNGSTSVPTLVPQATSLPTPTSFPVDIVDPMGIPMRLIPDGEFTMGSSADQAVLECQKYNVDYCQNNRFTNEEPVHQVRLDAFYMDIHEVTNANYKACVDARVCKPPQNNSSATRADYYGNSQFDNYPVVYVDWEMARTYCEWRGGHLPTEAQWEKAARGTSGRIYPWGNDMLRCGLANYNPQKSGLCVGDTTVVGSYADGISSYGMYDMAGNVWEWTLDWHTDRYDPNWPATNPTGASTGTKRVLRGSSWFDYDFSVRTTFRGKADPALADNYIGLRCARIP
jgi:serine/threonine-protein kinase